ncbi:MAG: cobalamin-binding protein [Pseudomonadales bacterium]|nr:cobalamin-binding protein [Pseudomonadales bacterium]
MFLIKPLAKLFYSLLIASQFLVINALAEDVLTKETLAKDALATTTIIDDMGVPVNLSVPAKRLVVLGPNLVESLYEIGAGEYILAASEYSDYPEAAKAIARVASHNIINFEEIVSLAPDLVMVWQSGFGVDAITKLRSLGLKVYASEPHTLDDIEDLLRDMGHLTGLLDGAELASARYRQKLYQLQADYSHKETVSVFYQVWQEPMQTLNGDHVMNDAIELCGGKNVFAALPEIAPRVSVESVIGANPKFIFSSGSNSQGISELAHWQRWSMIAAVQNQQVHFLQVDSLVRHAPRILEGAQQLCELLEQSRLTQKDRVMASE